MPARSRKPAGPSRVPDPILPEIDNLIFAAWWNVEDEFLGAIADRQQLELEVQS